MAPCTENDKKDPDQHNSIPEFTKIEIQVAINRLKKKGKRKTAVEYELNSSKTVVTTRKKKSGQSSTKLRSRKTSHQKAGERSEYRSFTKKETEKMQAITDQFVACQYYASCLPPYYTLDSLLLCTEYNLQIRRCFGPIIDVTTT